MSRLIDADALRDRIENHVTTVSACYTSQEAYGRTQMKMLALQDVDEAQTVDAIPVEWLRNIEVVAEMAIDDRMFVEWLITEWQKEQEAR